MKTIIQLCFLALLFTMCSQAQPVLYKIPMKHFDSTLSSQYTRTEVLLRKADTDSSAWIPIADILNELGIANAADTALYYFFIAESRTNPIVLDAADSIDVTITIQFGTSTGFAGVTIDTAITIRHNALGSVYKTYRRRIGELIRNSNVIRVIVTPENVNTPPAHSGNKKWTNGLAAVRNDE